MITMRDLLEAGVHFGHQTRSWHPKMAPYIFGTRNSIHIINLEETLPLLQEALNFLSELASKKGKVLFVGTKLAAREIVQQTATKCGMPYINHRWLGGMLTNYKTIRHRIKRLKELDLQFEKSAFGNLTKKEILTLAREREKLDRALGGVKKMGGLPDALFIIDVGHEKTAVEEAKKLHIPIIGIVDTNNDPSDIDYLIPGNDDSARAIMLYLELASDSILNGKLSTNILPEEEGTSEADEFIEISEEEIKKYETEPLSEEKSTTQ
jgi:small subunit ribosomal protein S2